MRPKCPFFLLGWRTSVLADVGVNAAGFLLFAARNAVGLEHQHGAINFFYNPLCLSGMRIVVSLF